MRRAAKRQWLALAGALVFGANGCDAREVAAAHVAERVASRASEEPVAASAAAAEAMVGVLVPVAEVVLTAPEFARLERIEVQVGDRVREGDVVAALDVREERHELAAATAAWEASKAELERLELELQRARETRSDTEQLEGVVSGAELREHRYAEKLAAARKRSASASLRQQRSSVEDASAKIVEAQLRAPFAGAISRRYVDAGATLELGRPVVQLISDARLVRFAVPEARGEALRLGAAVRVEFVDEGLTVTGEVTAIAPEIDAGTRLVFAEARLAPEDGPLQALRVGTVCKVEFVAR
ncbi:efflux RND transporter periplasmic adaptor subunit [Nannocystis pusilla]|uniref:Efflux RND transporter periplasmic adaptor subunit n=1 Tax=Nannocystis pusilla TaxID=889268 RepID=A0A9X3EJ46_9BACT|nr:efflux RND transporter periplasmic adaptor subunit [Nannocystis pusilla]MCY1004621.1 efflux RND transporter periplasmic adaptor subunit [Nannocystis pusilla]